MRSPGADNGRVLPLQRDGWRIRRDYDPRTTCIDEAIEIRMIEGEDGVRAHLFRGHQVEGIEDHAGGERSRRASGQRRAIDSFRRRYQGEHRSQSPHGTPRRKGGDPGSHREASQNGPGLVHGVPARDPFEAPCLHRLDPAPRTGVVTMAGHDGGHEDGRVDRDLHGTPRPSSSSRSSRSRRWSNSSSSAGSISPVKTNSPPSALKRESCPIAACAAASSCASSIESRSAGVLRSGVRMITSAGPVGRSSGNFSSTRWSAGMVMEILAAACMAGMIVPQRTVVGLGDHCSNLAGRERMMEQTSRYRDLKLVSRLDLGSGAVAMRYEPKR